MGEIMGTRSIHPDTRLGPVYLIVSDRDRARDFYQGILGFREVYRRDRTLALSAGGENVLVVLEERQNARPKPVGTTGLYHLAVLLPERKDLARVLRHLLETQYPLQGASDHLVSEALYLADPDGNGIEIYADRPRDRWPMRNGRLQMATLPLDGEGLLRELGQHEDRPWDGLPPRTCIGHIHLHVSDLRAAESFYHDLLGFDVMLYYGSSAVFLSAGGYHHHIGLNTWAGVGAPPPPPDAVGLQAFSIVLPVEEELLRIQKRLEQTTGLPLRRLEGALMVRDPSGNGVLLTAGPPPVPLEG